MDKAIAWRKTPKSDWFRNIIGPKGSITGATVIFGAEVMQNSSVSQIAITLGLVRYRDTFGYPHLIRICDYIRPQPGLGLNHYKTVKHSPYPRLRLAGVGAGSPSITAKTASAAQIGSSAQLRKAHKAVA